MAPGSKIEKRAARHSTLQRIALKATRVHFIGWWCGSHMSIMAGAQQPAMPVIGILSNPLYNALPAAFASFHRGLKDAGYVEG